VGRKERAIGKFPAEQSSIFSRRKAAKSLCLLFNAVRGLAKFERQSSCNLKNCVIITIRCKGRMVETKEKRKIGVVDTRSEELISIGKTEDLDSTGIPLRMLTGEKL